MRFAIVDDNELDIENVKNICCHDVQIEQAKTKAKRRRK